MNPSADSGALNEDHYGMTTRQLCAFLAIVLFYIATHSIFISNYPHVSMDEPWVSTDTYQYITKGVFRNPSFYRPDFESRWDKSKNIFFVNRYALYPVYYFFGTGVTQGRIFMASLGLATLFFSFLTARQLFNTNIALLATLLLSIDSLFIYSTRMIRFETLGTALSVACIYCYLRALKEKGIVWAVAAGLLCGFCVFNHPVGAWVAVAVTLMTIYYDKHNFWKNKFFWTTAVTAFLAFLPYFFTNSISDIFGYRQALNNYTQGTFGDKNPFLAGVKNELNTIRSVYFSSKIVSGIMAVVVLSAALFVKRFKTGLLLLIMAAFVIWSFILPSSHPFYYAYLSPFLAMLLAVFYFSRKDVFSFLGKKASPVIAVIILLLYAGNHLAYFGAVLYRNRNYDYAGLARAFDQIPIRCERVVSDYVFWFHLKDKDFLSAERLANDTDALFKFKPQAVILSKHTLDWMPQAERKNLFDKLNAYLTDNGADLFKTINTPYYGPIKIYLLKN